MNNNTLCKAHGIKVADKIAIQTMRRHSNSQEAGFTNINLDIMSALPGQSVENYKKTLETVLSLKLAGISPQLPFASS